MSRLDSFIRRLEAQRAAIDYSARLIEKLDGPILELGLGNGRTYDHLRERFPGREIFVFDRELAAHPNSRPDEAHFIEGDFRVTLRAARERIGSPAALAHCDIGSHDVAASQALAAAVAPLLVPLLAKGALVLGDQPMVESTLCPLPLPQDLEPGRYFMYRRE